MTSTDILAVHDVVVAVGESADSMTPEQAAETLDALQRLKAATATAISMVETQLKQTLEQPKVINGRLYAVKRDGKWRPIHARIKAALVGWAIVDRDTGETYNREQAVRRAVDLCYDAYVSPATMPKVGLLTSLGLDKSDVAQFEQTGTRLTITDLEQT
jgi:hypothetical protein